MTSLVSPGRLLITFSNLAYSLGAFLADWNETHIFNPSWPPHAKFHNSQTMSLGLLLATTSIYLAFSRPQTREKLFWTAMIGSFYCAAGLSAILYPGTDWSDPDRPTGGEQKYVFVACVVGCWVGYALEVAGVGAGKGKRG